MAHDDTPTDDHEDEPVVQYRGAELDQEGTTGEAETPGPDFDPAVQYRGAQPGPAADEADEPGEADPDFDPVVEYRGAEVDGEPTSADEG